MLVTISLVLLAWLIAALAFGVLIGKMIAGRKSSRGISRRDDPAGSSFPPASPQSDIFQDPSNGTKASAEQPDVTKTL